MVNGVEQFGAEDEVNTLSETGGLFERQHPDSGRGIVDIGQIAADIAECVLRRLHKGRGIEVEATIADLRPARQRRGDAGGVGPHAGTAAQRVRIIRR